MHRLSFSKEILNNPTHNRLKNYIGKHLVKEVKDLYNETYKPKGRN
jgi:tRNA A37 N6-isopentenylltransferase MiaA